MEKATTKSHSSLKPKLQKTRAKVAANLRGNPAKKLQIITVTGDEGKDTVAHLIHKILLAGNHSAALILNHPNASISPSELHKYLAQALKNGATHVVVDVPAQSLQDHALHDVPVHLTILASPSSTNQPPENPALAHLTPQFVVFNHDHPHPDQLPNFPPKNRASYGYHRDAIVRINRHKLYKKGTEANLAIGPNSFDAATFAIGEPAVSYMAAAAAAAHLLGISPDIIIEGIASYEPQPSSLT